MKKYLAMWTRIIKGSIRKNPWNIFLAVLPVFMTLIFGMTIKDIGGGMHSFQYYSVVQITFMTMYIIGPCVNSMKREEKSDIVHRISMAGISLRKYYFTNYIGFMILSAILVFPAFIISIKFMDAKWGAMPWFSYICIMSLSSVMISLGLMLVKLVKEIWNIMSVINTIIIPFTSYLGGAFVWYNYEASQGLSLLSKLSLTRWINQGILEMAYKNSYSTIMKSLCINLILTCVFMGIVMWSCRKEETALC